jgi:hypothetical protein
MLDGCLSGRAGGRTGPRAALALTGIDGFYTATGVLRPVYLLDAAVELGIAAAWGSAARTSARLIAGR